MLTIFATAKPFLGHDGIIQRNAISTWVRLHPACEVILFGDEPGTADVARQFRLRHEPDIRRNEFGTPLLDSLFARAQQIATYDLLCYVNCDIVLLSCFCEAILNVNRWSSKFLVVGRRWNSRVNQPLDFEHPDWEMRLRSFAISSGHEQPSYAVDYFVFPRHLYVDLPPLAIGRFYWDHWLVWKARSVKVPVVDASAAVLAIHQEHDLASGAAKARDQNTDPEAKRNRVLAGGLLNLYTIEHATHRIVAGRVVDRPGRWHVPATFFARTYLSQLWYWLLKCTFRARHALGLYREGLQTRPGDVLDRRSGSGAAE